MGYTFVDTNELTSDQINQWLIPFVCEKSSNLSRTSTTTLTDDPDLSFAAEANCVYAINGNLRFNGASSGGGLKVGFSLPAGAVWVYNSNRFRLSGEASPYSLDETAASAETLGTGTDLAWSIGGTLIMSSTADTFALQWAQDSSSGTATTLVAPCYMFVRRIA